MENAVSNNLKGLSVGDRGKVVGYEAGGRTYRKKLLSLGLTPGADIELVRVAPMGDPVEVRVRGTSVSLRKGEADALQVEKQS
jgi:ferrous iron transport protein A